MTPIVEPRAAVAGGGGGRGRGSSGGGGAIRSALLVKHATALFTITPRRVEVLLYNWTAHARRRLRAQVCSSSLFLLISSFLCSLLFFAHFLYLLISLCLLIVFCCAHSSWCLRSR